MDNVTIPPEVVEAIFDQIWPRSEWDSEYECREVALAAASAMLAAWPGIEIYRSGWVQDEKYIKVEVLLPLPAAEEKRT